MLHVLHGLLLLEQGLPAGLRADPDVVDPLGLVLGRQRGLGVPVDRQHPLADGLRGLRDLLHGGRLELGAFHHLLNLLPGGAGHALEVEALDAGQERLLGVGEELPRGLPLARPIEQEAHRLHDDLHEPRRPLVALQLFDVLVGEVQHFGHGLLILAGGGHDFVFGLLLQDQHLLVPLLLPDLVLHDLYLHLVSDPLQLGDFQHTLRRVADVVPQLWLQLVDLVLSVVKVPHGLVERLQGAGEEPDLKCQRLGLLRNVLPQVGDEVPQVLGGDLHRVPRMGADVAGRVVHPHQRPRDRRHVPPVVRQALLDARGVLDDGQDAVERLVVVALLHALHPTDVPEPGVQGGHLLVPFSGHLHQNTEVVELGPLQEAVP